MRRLLCLAIAAAASAAQAATPLYVVPDVPTNPTPGFPTLFPWRVVRYTTGPTASAGLGTIPGTPALDGLHKLDKPGAWLFSLESSSDLGSLLPSSADARDVVRLDGPSTYTKFFCGGSVSGAIPNGSNVDALLMSGGDA